VLNIVIIAFIIGFVGIIVSMMYDWYKMNEKAREKRVENES